MIVKISRGQDVIVFESHQVILRMLEKKEFNRFVVYLDLPSNNEIYMSFGFENKKAAQKLINAYFDGLIRKADWLELEVTQ